MPGPDWVNAAPEPPSQPDDALIVCERLTPAIRLCRTVAPTLRGVSEAPTTSTDRGRNRCPRFLMLIVISDAREAVNGEEA